MTATTPRTELDVVALLNALRDAGVRVSPNGGNLRYTSTAPVAPDLLKQLGANKAVVLSYLGIWDARRAIALEADADGLVAQLGVPGSDPEIQDAADRCAEAHHAHDMATVRAMCHRIENRTRKLAARPAT